MKNNTPVKSERMSLNEFKSQGLDKKISNSSSGIKKRTSKYNAKKVVIDDITFDSTFEGKRYLALKLKQRIGDISDLTLQVPFKIVVNNAHICSYIADFVYVEHDMKIVEDAKGVKTPEYQLKKKLMKAVFNIDIRETFAS